MGNFLNKFNAWYYGTDAGTQLSFNVLMTCLTYFFVNAISPVWVKMLTDFVITFVMLGALGMFALHLIVGPNKLLLPVYKALYRITGNEFYLNPLVVKPTKEKETEHVK